jgi:hypothetical protein
MGCWLADPLAWRSLVRLGLVPVGLSGGCSNLLAMAVAARLQLRRLHICGCWLAWDLPALLRSWCGNRRLCELVLQCCVSCWVPLPVGLLYRTGMCGAIRLVDNTGPALVGGGASAAEAQGVLMNGSSRAALAGSSSADVADDAQFAEYTAGLVGTKAMARAALEAIASNQFVSSVTLLENASLLGERSERASLYAMTLVGLMLIAAALLHLVLRLCNWLADWLALDVPVKRRLACATLLVGAICTVAVCMMPRVSMAKLLLMLLCARHLSAGYAG